MVSSGDSKAAGTSEGEPASLREIREQISQLQLQAQQMTNDYVQDSCSRGGSNSDAFSFVSQVGSQSGGSQTCSKTACDITGQDCDDRRNGRPFRTTVPVLKGDPTGAVDVDVRVRADCQQQMASPGGSKSKPFMEQSSAAARRRPPRGTHL